jgi:tetratricopeptide (TPR) repeat protein
MPRTRLILLAAGIPGILVYGVLVLAQGLGGVALAEFRRLQERHPPDSLQTEDPAVLGRKLSALARAARSTPADPEPPYRAALLHLVAAEARSLSPRGAPRTLEEGPDPEVAALLRDGLRAVRRAVDNNPASAEAHFATALLLQNLQGTGGASLDETAIAEAVERHLATADRMDPYKPSLHYRIGSFRMALGERDEAKRCFSVALAGRDYQYALEIFNILWSEVQDPAEMGELIGSEPRARVLLGEFLWRGGHPEAARVEYERALAEDPSDYETNLGLINYYIRSRQYREALARIDRLEGRGVRWHPYQRASLEYLRGRVFFLTHDLEQAIRSYRASLAIDDTPDHVHHELAVAYLKMGETARAVARWRYLVDARGRSPYVQKNLGAIRRGLGSAYEARAEYTSALAEYLKLSELEPGDREVSRKILEISRKM